MHCVISIYLAGFLYVASSGHGQSCLTVVDSIYNLIVVIKTINSDERKNLKKWKMAMLRFEGICKRERVQITLRRNVQA